MQTRLCQADNLVRAPPQRDMAAMETRGAAALPSLAALGVAALDDADVEVLEEVVDYLLVAAKSLEEELVQAERERQAVQEQLEACERKREALLARQAGLAEKLARAQQPLRAG